MSHSKTDNLAYHDEARTPPNASDPMVAEILADRRNMYGLGMGQTVVALTLGGLEPYYNYGPVPHDWQAGYDALRRALMERDLYRMMYGPLPKDMLDGER